MTRVREYLDRGCCVRVVHIETKKYTKKESPQKESLVVAFLISTIRKFSHCHI